jgi:predicted thioredoxin/glutaredoxin
VRLRDQVDVIEEIEHTVDLGVLSVPAIAIDGELVFTGLPSAQRLHDELIRCLEPGPQ